MAWPTSGHREPRLWLTDHGAALVFHHRWETAVDAVGKACDFRHHALGCRRPDLVAADAELADRVTAELPREVVAAVPDAWLLDEPGFGTPDEVRDAYVTHLAARARVSARRLPQHLPDRAPLPAR